MNEFKLNFVGLDTTTIDYLSPITESGSNLETDTYDFDYFHTSIKSNNDYCSAEVIKNSISPATYFVTIDSLDQLITTSMDILKQHEDVINSSEKHMLNTLLFNAESIDILSLTKEDMAKFQEVMRDFYYVDEIGIRNPKSIEEVKHFENLLKSIEFELEYIALNVCPLSFNYPIIKWANENNIPIIGFNIFGGHISSPAIIDSFSVPYLLGFAATYCTYVMLSGRDLFLAEETKDYLEELLTSGATPKVEYGLRKSVNKLIKPLNKVVNTSLELDEDLTLTYSSPNLMFGLENELSFSFKTEINILPVLNTDSRTKLENEVNEYLVSTVDIIEGLSKELEFAQMRYATLNHLKYKYPKENYNIELVKIGDTIVSIRIIPKETIVTYFGIWKKREKPVEVTRYFILATVSQGKTIFTEVSLK